MKHYVDSDGQVHGLWANGEQDHIIKPDWVAIEDHEIQAHVDRKQQAEFDKPKKNMPSENDMGPLPVNAPVKKYKKGGKVSSASKRADGCASKGKTKGRLI